MQVFVIGCKGYIGWPTVKILKSYDFSVMAVSSHPDPGMLHLDLSLPDKFSYNHIKVGDVILMTAALSSPDVCREQTDLANAINVVGTGYFIERCLELGARVLFFSSDTVYGPGETERTEAAICYPAGEYAFMKREVETRFADHPAIKVLRLSYVFSSGDKFTSYLTACARARKEAEIFHPMFRRAVYLGDLLELLKLICTAWDKITDKVINVCGPELLSRVDMAHLYREVVAPALQFNIVQPPPEFFVARPQVINMSDLAFRRVLGRLPRNIRDAMHLEFNHQEGFS